MIDERLLKRLRQALGPRRGLAERRMFGGVALLLNGNMCCGVTKDGEVVVRIGAGAYDEALADADVRECDFTGRPMRGMVMLTAPALRSPARLRRWVGRAADFAASLPRKAAASRAVRRRS